MKAGIVFTGTGPILILTSCDSLEHPDLVARLCEKGISKYVEPLLWEPPVWGTAQFRSGFLASEDRETGF
jgi:hypothetical protein